MALSNALLDDRRRDLTRVPANLKVVVARSNGEKLPAMVIDVSKRGMHLYADHSPGYGEAVTVVVQFGRSPEWQVIPATVRWFDRRGFGVAFQDLGDEQVRALESFVLESGRGPS